MLYLIEGAEQSKLGIPKHVFQGHAEPALQTHVTVCIADTCDLQVARGKASEGW